MSGLGRILRRLRRDLAPAGREADAALLRRFADCRDEAAFADLVRRHGPMVWRACRRALVDPGAVEDAFQATFLVLARRAGSLHHPERLAGWLHGVAVRVARKSAAVRRPRQWADDTPEPTAPHPDPPDELSVREALTVIDEEVSRLPEACRLPVLLCCLEGLTLEEAAARLGWTRGSVKGRLERGRARLHARLLRRGLTLSAALAALELTRQLGSAATNASADAFATAAVHFVDSMTSGGTPAVLAQEVLRSMSLTRLKLLIAPLVVLAGALAASGWWAVSAGSGSPAPAPKFSAVAEDEPEPAGKPRPNKTVLLESAAEGVRHVAAMQFTPDSKELLTAGLKSWKAEPSSAVARWDVATGKLRGKAVRLPAECAPLDLSRDGKIALASRGMGAALVLVALSTGKEINLGEHAMAHAGGFSPDGKAVLTWSASASSKWIDSELKVWDAGTGKLRFALDGSGKSNEKAFYHPSFSPDGKSVLVTRGPPTYAVQLLDSKTGKEVASLGSAGSGIPNAVWSADGKWVAAWSSETKELGAFEVATKKATTLKGHTGSVRAAAFSADGKSLVSAALDGTARVWDLKTAKATAELSLGVGKDRLFANSIELDPKGKFLVVLGRDSKTIGKAWDLRSREEVASWTGAVQAAFSPDGKSLAVATSPPEGFGGLGLLKQTPDGPDTVRLMPVEELTKRQEKKEKD